MQTSSRPGTGPGGLASMLQNAFALNQAGRLDDAKRAANAILKIQPREANALYLLGIVAHQQGDAKKAAQWFEKSHKADRNNPAAISGLGIVRLEQRRYREAARLFEQVLKAMPNDPSTHNNMGLACERCGEMDKALDHYRRAIAIAPGYEVARLSLAQALFRLERKDQAEQVLREGLVHTQGNAAFHSELAQVCRADGRLEEAAELLDKAAALDPRDPQILIDKSTVLAELGQSAEAETCLGAARDLDPDNLIALLELAEIASSRTGRDAETQKARGKSLMEDAVAAAERRGLSTIESPQLLHRLGRAYDRLKRFDDAFTCWSRAHAAWKQELENLNMAYSEKRVEAAVDRTIAWFDSHREAARPAGIATRKPIFVVGMMRSGTSLLEQILATHSAIEGAGELTTITEFAARLGQGRAHWTDAPALKDPAALAEMADEYLRVIDAKYPDAPFVVDKMPANYQYLGLIRIIFPAATIIHIRRNPVDTCLSIFMQKFANGYTFAHDLGQIGHNYRAYRRMMRLWQDWDAGLLTVDYEALTSDMQTQIRPIIDKLGLSWEDGLEKFYETQRAVGTASRLQVRQPLYATAVDRWRRYEAHLPALIEALGDEAGID
ncbi:sulfotransferase family protein [Hwanghaeella grinnelliae]|uniref:Sulfotransferase family protein n=1 Tax=Hwanghaeella grinnelliae TaxID=2500179 RepID=A0A437QNZ4_9PROT|nr:tetratricopeptide repeat-containing sulfotransferase family protein [Hwanghaeella grinnelliae]RVU36252.1 sulfotransferase family protein [Hwanghaeella grinnelliae]